MAINDNYFVMPININRVCRICLQENSNLSPIFCNGQIINDRPDISEKIKVCGAIECHEQDGLPAMICNDCMYKASIAHEFRQLCQHSDNRLRLYYNKPPKYNATDSGTQTELHTQALITEAADELQNAYFVKQEAINNHHFHNTISNEEYNSQNSSETLIISQNSSVIPNIEQSIPVVGEKLFHCHINFEEHQKNAGSSDIVPHDSQRVACSQQLIPVSNIIEEVCTMETEMNPVENQVKADMNYFNYIKCDPYLKGDSMRQEPLHQEQLPEGPLMEENLIEEPLREECTSEEPQTEESLEEVDDSEELDRKPELTSNDSFNEEENNLETEKQTLKFKCDVCSKSYSTEKCFKRHQWTHKKQHKCEICCRTFNELENLEKHKNIHVRKPFACQLCHTSFCKSENLIKHLSTHSEKNFEMNDTNNQKAEIEKQNSKNKSLDSDMNNEVDEFESAPKIFKCEECGKYCSTLKNLKRHTLIHGERKYSCTVCKKWFFRPDTLKKHAERHGHGLLDNIIDRNKLYESDEDFLPNDSNHSSVKNEDEKKEGSEDDGSGNFKCQHCDKVLNSKKGLRRHVALHKPKPEPSSCEICKKVFSSRARLTIHLKTHNKSKEKVTREYLCHICSKVYPSNSSLTYHMRTHTGVKPHVCKICNSGFTTTTSLANHTRIHTGDRPFVCHVCSAAFAVSSAFRRHLTRHTGEANYHCKTCGKAFKRLSTLKEHTYTHSGEKPYVCKTCGAAYSHSGSLFAHQKRCKAQYNDAVIEDDRVVIENHHNDNMITHHIHVNNMQPAVRPLAVIGPIF